MGAAYTQRAGAPFLPRAEVRGLLAEIDKLPATCALVDPDYQSGLASECPASQAGAVPDRSCTGLSATCACSRCSGRSSAAFAPTAAPLRSLGCAATTPRFASRATRSSQRWKPLLRSAALSSLCPNRYEQTGTAKIFDQAKVVLHERTNERSCPQHVAPSCF